MGKNSSKFYEAQTNTEYGAVFLGKQGLDLIFGNEEFRAAVVEAASNFWDSHERVDHGTDGLSRTQLVGKIGKTDFDARMMIQQNIVKEFIYQLSRSDWRLVTFCNLQEGQLYGHSWIFKRERPDASFENSISLNPADNNEIYISGTSTKFAGDVEDILRNMSTEKGIKEVERFEQYNGIKMVLRHKPWNLDEFDWWGGAYLLSKVIEKLASYQMPIYIQGSPMVDLSKRAGVCFVVPVEGNKVKFRRASQKSIRDFKERVQEFWPDGVVEDSVQDDMGTIVEFRENPWSTQHVLLALFRSMHEAGFSYQTGLRASSGGKGRSAMCFATGRDPPGERLAALHLCDKGSIDLSNIKEDVAAELATVAAASWHKGLKNSTTDRINLNGSPWSEEIYPDMIMCNVLQAMDNHGYGFVAAVATGVGGDVFIFEET